MGFGAYAHIAYGVVLPDLTEEEYDKYEDSDVDIEDRFEYLYSDHDSPVEYVTAGGYDWGSDAPQMIVLRGSETITQTTEIISRLKVDDEMRDQIRSARAYCDADERLPSFDDADWILYASYG